MRKNIAFVWLGIGILLMVAWPLGLTRAGLEPEAVTENPDWLGTQPISISDPAVKSPSVAAYPGDGHVIVAYSVRSQGTDNNDVAYRLSANYGQTWSPASYIYQSAGSDSKKPRVAFDSNGVAHAVWSDAEERLAYAAQSDWGGQPSSIFNGTAIDPNLAIANDNSLHVVWAGLDGGFFKIHYARLASGAVNWSTSVVTPDPAFPTNSSPSVAFNPANPDKVYVVWEQPVNPFADVSVYYSEGTWSNGSMSWSDAIEISELQEGELGDSEDVRPNILWQNGTRQVIYTHVSEVDRDVQSVYHTTCSSNCTSRSGWTAQQNISGQGVGANPSTPFVVESTMTSLQGCLFVYYHGTDLDFFQDNEAIWGGNSCDGFGAVRDQVTNPEEIRAIKPAMTVHPDGWLYLAYVEYTKMSTQTTRQVYFVRAQVEIERGVYLPIISR